MPINKTNVTPPNSKTLYVPRVRRPSPEPTRSLAPVLARVGDPFVAPDGTLIPPEYPEDYFPRVKENTKVDPLKFRGKRRRNLSELPGQPNVLNAVGAVMLYTMFGVGDREIATALKCTASDIEEVRMHTAYAEYLELLGTEIISAESDNITHRMAAYAHGALDTIAHVSRNGKLEGNRLRASMDIMDRGGFAPKVIQDKQISLKNVLRIQVMDDKSMKSSAMDIEIVSEVSANQPEGEQTDGNSAKSGESEPTD